MLEVWRTGQEELVGLKIRVDHRYLDVVVVVGEVMVDVRKGQGMDPMANELWETGKIHHGLTAVSVARDH